MKVIVLEYILEGLRYLSVDSVVELLALLFFKSLLLVCAGTGTELSRRIGFVASGCLLS